MVSLKESYLFHFHDQKQGRKAAKTHWYFVSIQLVRLKTNINKNKNEPLTNYYLL
jgi:hypothetical protein